jgi:hypothetical protein
MNNAQRLQAILDLIHDGTDWREELDCADVVQDLTGLMAGYLTGEDEPDAEDEESPEQAHAGQIARDAIAFDEGVTAGADMYHRDRAERSSFAFTFQRKDATHFAVTRFYLNLGDALADVPMLSRDYFPATFVEVKPCPDPRG